MGNILLSCCKTPDDEEPKFDRGVWLPTRKLIPPPASVQKVPKMRTISLERLQTLKNSIAEAVREEEGKEACSSTGPIALRHLRVQLPNRLLVRKAFGM